MMIYWTMKVNSTQAHGNLIQPGEIESYFVIFEFSKNTEIKMRFPTE